MAVELEITDGTPWYLSPNVWVVADPSDTTESLPVAGTPCYIKARVKNNGSTSATNATVNFYWGNPAAGVNRSTATFVGQAFVSLSPGEEQDVLCLTPWVPIFLNDGHECILAEAFHASDPLPASLDFNVPTDRHVAQRNLSVIMAAERMFFMNFEMHNNQREPRKLTARVAQVPIEKIIKSFPLIEKTYKLSGKKEGKLLKSVFTNNRCGGKDFEQPANQEEAFELTPYGKKQMTLTGEIDGDYVFLLISQYAGKTETGGLGILIINPKNNKI